MLRTHDVVLTDGTFRVLLTPTRTVVAVLDVETSPLGPLHLAFNIDRAPRLASNISPAFLNDPQYVQYGPEVTSAVRDASMRTFEDASSAARTIAEPAFQLTRHAANEGANIIRYMPATRAQHHARHLVMRFRLGDLNAKALIRGIVRDAKAGVAAARHAADSLMSASKYVAKVVDVPVSLASQMQGAGGAGSPLSQLHEVLGAVKRGDFHEVGQMLQAHLGEIEGGLANVPGIGSGISAGIRAGLSAIAGDHPIETAIKAAYGAACTAIPMSPDVRKAADIALDAVLAFVEHPHNLTEAALQVARNQTPQGAPRDVFDTLVHILVKHVPIQQEVVAVASHLASQYAGTVGVPALKDAVKGLGLDPALVQHVAATVANLGGGRALSLSSGQLAPMRA